MDGYTITLAIMAAANLAAWLWLAWVFADYTRRPRSRK